MKDYLDKLMPENFKGKQNDLDFSKSYTNSGDAEKAFDAATKRVLIINEWHTLSGIASTDFILKNHGRRHCSFF